MSMNLWKKHPDGSIAVNPVVGWSTATFMKGMAGGLRIEYALDPTMSSLDAVQLVLTKPQVAELRDWLGRLHDQLQSELDADVPKGPPS